MTDRSYNLSGMIDPVLVDILCQVHQEASSRHMTFFVIGATARDILLHHCRAIRSFRQTRDLDIGIEIADGLDFNNCLRH